MKKRILIADDERKIRKILTQLLEDNGYQTCNVSNGEQCLSEVEEFDPHLILLDLKMPVKDGMTTLEELARRNFKGQVIILTAFGDIPTAVRAVRSGAHDFLAKPFDADVLLLTIEKAIEQARMSEELKSARSRLDDKFSLGGIITTDHEMKRLLDTVEKIAPTDISVLIVGESGTGKELFAQAIHQNSNRKNARFLSLNCSAIPVNLIESELFGYKKGAFSGANVSKPGLVDRADGGTLFLDEISEMGFEVQAKLLRFTQSGEYIPLGGTAAKKVDVRILSASNQDLNMAIQENRFRADLFYRLSAVVIPIPALRDRTNDIPLLVKHFIEKHGKAQNKNDFRLSVEAMQVLMAFSWPGNVRELENAIHSALIMADESPVDTSCLPAHITSIDVDFRTRETGESVLDFGSKQKDVAERVAILEAMKNSKWDYNKAADVLGISRSTLFRRLKKFGIRQEA